MSDDIIVDLSGFTVPQLSSLRDKVDARIREISGNPIRVLSVPHGGSTRIQVIKALRCLGGLDLKRAYDLSANAPFDLIVTRPECRAEEVEFLRKLGCEVEA